LTCHTRMSMSNPLYGPSMNACLLAACSRCGCGLSYDVFYEVRSDCPFTWHFCSAITASLGSTFGPFDNTNQPLSTSPTQTIEHSMSSTTEPQPPGSTPRAQKISYPASHSKLGTLWSRSLPEYSGEYPVGAVDVEFPIPKQRRPIHLTRVEHGEQDGINLNSGFSSRNLFMHKSALVP
jgi:hypothetical protein